MVKEKTKLKKSLCLFCSLGCGTAFRSNDDRLIAIDYDKENPINLGSICPRGYYNYEILMHPGRITRPHIGNRSSSWPEALSRVKKELSALRPENIGILLSCNSTNEDAYVATQMANNLGIKNIAASGDASDIEAFQGYKWGAPAIYRADVDKIGDFDALMIIGDLLTRSPVLSKRVNKVKYGKRGNQVIVIDPNITHTSWFATSHLRNRPGTEAVLLAGVLAVLAEENKRAHEGIDIEKVAEVTGVPSAQIRKAAKSFDEAASGCIIFVPGKNKERNDLIQYLINTASSYSINKKHITLFSYGNTIGVNTILDAEVEGHASHEEILENRSIKSLFLLGDDLDLHSTKFELVIKTGLFKGTHNKNEVFLPIASHMERKGHVTLAGLRPGALVPIAHNVGSRSLWKVLASLNDLNIGFDEILHQTWKIMMKGVPQKKVSLSHIISETMEIRPKDATPIENITHFGNNDLVKNFFWYRVNNRS